MKSAKYITINALNRFAFVLCLQLIIFGLQLWLSNIMAGPFSPPFEVRLRGLALMFSSNVVVVFLAAFAINIYPAYKVAKKFNLSFEEGVILVSKLQVLYDKQMDDLTESYVLAELEKDSGSIRLI